MTRPGTRAADQNDKPARLHSRGSCNESDKHSQNAVEIAAASRLLLRQAAEAKINNALAAMYAIVIRLCVIF